MLWQNIGRQMILYRECCFPNCTKSWWVKLLSQVLRGTIAPFAPPPTRPWLSNAHRSFFLISLTAVYCSESKYQVQQSKTQKKENWLYKSKCSVLISIMTSFFQIDLGLSRQALLSKKFIADHKELDPTMSSIELNMRVCLSVESGEFNNALTGKCSRKEFCSQQYCKNCSWWNVVFEPACKIFSQLLTLLSPVTV